MHTKLTWVLVVAAFASACTTATSEVSVRTTEATLTDGTQTRAAADQGIDPSLLSGELSYEVVARYPHLTSSFTQGLEFLDDRRLVESVGGFGESGRAIVDLETGSHLEFVPLDESLFGEGMTQVEDELVQISWVAGVAVVSDAETLEEKQRIEYEGEGWGLCFTGKDLAMSNGSGELTFRDPASLAPLRFLGVTSAQDGLTGQLNELECVGDRIWANVYFRNHIMAINSTTGEVEAWVDLSALVPPVENDTSVLNGIAYRPETNTFFVTGKNWPELFELRLTVR